MFLLLLSHHFFLLQLKHANLSISHQREDDYTIKHLSANKIKLSTLHNKKLYKPPAFSPDGVFTKENACQRLQRLNFKF